MSITAETRALPHEHWTEANLVQIVAAERLASEGPVPASLLPLAVFAGELRPFLVAPHPLILLTGR